MVDLRVFGQCLSSALHLMEICGCMPRDTAGTLSTGILLVSGLSRCQTSRQYTREVPSLYHEVMKPSD